MLRNLSSVASGGARPAPSTALNSPEKILIVRLGALGDIVHALPAQQQIHHRFPDCEIHWLVEPHYRGLLETVPGIHRIWTADTKRWRRRPRTALDLVRLVRALRRERFDLAVDFQGLIKSAFLARLSGAGRRMGFCRERCREPAAAGFYTDTVATRGNGHVIDLNLELAGSLGCSGESTARVPFRIPAEAKHYVDSRLQAVGGVRPVLLNPGAGWPTKLWPARRFARLGSEIRRRLNLPVLITYGPGEEDLVREIRDCSRPGSVVSFPTTILELAALCRRACLMVAGDTGPLHLAVAVGTPAVAVMGPSIARRNGPFHPEDRIVKRYLYCSDCNKRSCGEFICMNISVEQVFRAVRRRLSAAVGGPAPR